jgi:hypothetical protein
MTAARMTAGAPGSLPDTQGSCCGCSTHMEGYGPVDDAGIRCKLQRQPVLGLNYQIALQHNRQDRGLFDSTSDAASLTHEPVLLHAGWHNSTPCTVYPLCSTVATAWGQTTYSL